CAATGISHRASPGCTLRSRPSGRLTRIFWQSSVEAQHSPNDPEEAARHRGNAAPDHLDIPIFAEAECRAPRSQQYLALGVDGDGLAAELDVAREAYLHDADDEGRHFRRHLDENGCALIERSLHQGNVDVVRDLRMHLSLVTTPDDSRGPTLNRHDVCGA